jgi:hypothetical protein
MVTWAEFFYSIYGLITVGVGSLLIGIIIGLVIGQWMDRRDANALQG